MNFLDINLKHLRKIKGITQEQLARKLGINRSMIGAYEEGRAEPKMETILNICHYFEIDINSLILNDLSKTEKTGEKIDFQGKQLRHKAVGKRMDGSWRCRRCSQTGLDLR